MMPKRHVAAQRERIASRSKGIAAAMAIVVMLVLVGRCEGQGTLKLANVLGDSMVLQVHTPCPFAMFEPLINKTATSE